MTKRNAKWLIAAAGAVVSGILFLKMVVDIFFAYAARGRSLKLLGGRKRDKAKRQLNYLFHDRINNILPPFLNLGTLGLNYGMHGFHCI